MKIALLGAANSVHLHKIAKGLIEKGNKVAIISLPNHRFNNEIAEFEIIYLKHSGYLGYYLNAKQLKGILKKKQFELMNVHYASGYGILGRLSAFHPTILSVWGSDIYTFPRSNIINRNIVIKNLLFSDEIFSTSYCMADEIKKYIGESKRIVITPFGVDINVFKKIGNRNNRDSIVLGFLKGTDFIYGIDVFFDAFKLILEWAENYGYNIEAIICGACNNKKIEKIVKTYDLDDRVNFLGKVSHENMPYVINNCDIVCIPSRKESFGVTAIEALACEVPCVTSNAPGLQEIMQGDLSNYVVECDALLFANKIISLILDKEKRIFVGKQGRALVRKCYNIDNNINVFCNEFNRYKGKK